MVPSGVVQIPLFTVPLAAMLPGTADNAAAQLSPCVGALVDIWSTSGNGFVRGHVADVDGSEVTVTWNDPATGAAMQKTLPAQHAQLHWPGSAAEPVTAVASAPWGSVEHPYKAKTDVEVWSSSNQQWLRGKVEFVSGLGKVYVVTKLPDGSPASKELEAGHPHLRLFFRPVCAEGTKCASRRDEGHLAKCAHPFDTDYLEACKARGHEPVQPSLHGLFEWVDADNSGKVSRAELEAAMPLLSKMRGEAMHLSEGAWKALDDDGNGAVSFNEFASWGGPRLGLPLGVQHLFRAGSKGSFYCESPGCGIFGCPCDGYKPRIGSKTQYIRQSLGGALKWSFGIGIGDMCESMLKSLATCSKCGHKQSAHPEPNLLCGEVPCPSYWSSHRSSSSSSDGSRSMDFVPLHMPFLGLVQQLFDMTYKNTWTRDRRKHQPAPHNVPRAYRVVRAFRCENTLNWRGYHVRRAQLLQNFADASGREKVTLIGDVKSAVAWDSLARPFAADHALAADCNEWYLFHGTTPDAAQNICRTNIKLSLAGGNTGSLYGRGLYCAESITKADEYSQPNAAGEFAVLICRVLGGRVLYTDELEPDPEKLVSSCIEGPYDSVLGDREKCRGTYREFVFFDAENMYPEYIVHYVRDM